MRTLRSSVGVLLWTQAVHLAILVVLGGLVLAARPAAATLAGVAPAARPMAAPPATRAPAPSPALVAISGRVVARGNGLLAVHEQGGDGPVAFMIGSGALLTREGNAVALDALRHGDDVRMVVDGRTGQVLRLQAEPGPARADRAADAPAAVAAVALVAAAVLFVRRQSRAWPAVGRVAGSRPLLAMLRRRLAFPGQTVVVRGRSGAQRCGA